MSSTLTRNHEGTSAARDTHAVSSRPGSGHVGSSHRAPESTLDSVLTWLVAGRSERSPWRVVAAAAAIGEAAAHIPVTKEHLTEAPYIGVGFVLVTVAGFILAQLLLTADTRAVWLATAAVSALALAAFMLSRTVGLPEIQDDIGNWSDPLGIVAIVSEAVMLATAIAHLSSRRRRY